MDSADELRTRLLALAAELERLDDGSFPRSPSWVVLRAREIAANAAPAVPTRDLLDEIDHEGSLERLRGSAEDVQRLRTAMVELRAQIAALLARPSVGTPGTVSETRAERRRDPSSPSIIVDDDRARED